MATQNSTERFQLGALVSIRNSGFRQAQIVELRGPLGPQGAFVYRVRAGNPSQPVYLEVVEDQLEPLAAESHS